MDALKALHTRTSVPKLEGPAPNEQELKNLFAAAFRTADHALLRPWRFLVISGEARLRLGDLFVQAKLSDQPDTPADQLEKLRAKPLRAPTIIVTIGCHKEHPKVPAIEQDLSAGGATQQTLLAAHAMGLGAIWKTGSMAYHPMVSQGLGLKEAEKLISFLYIGHIAGPVKSLRELKIDDFVQWW